MKRAAIISSIVLIIDQVLKFYFQFNFDGIKLLLSKDWGFTFVTNPGITVNQNLSDSSVLFIQLYVLAVFFLIILSVKYYNKKIGNSIYVDLAFAFFSTALLGNIIIDRILFGGIRDYFITPIGVANFADYCGLLAFLLVFLEFVFNQKLKTIFFKRALA